MESTTDAAEWKLEMERVLPLLKVHIRTDNKVQFAIDIRILPMSSLQPFYGHGDLTSFDTKFSCWRKELLCMMLAVRNFSYFK